MKGLYYELEELLRRFLAGLVYAVIGLALVFGASLVWHFGQYVMQGWLG